MKTATKLKALVKKNSDEKGVDPQILLRKYFMDKFLEKLRLSKYKENFILKGGILVSALVGEAQRATMDIDATLKGEYLSENNLEVILKEIISIDNDDDIVFEVDRVELIMDERDYIGLRAYIKVYFDGIKQKINIDISTGDVITPKEMNYEYATLLEKRKISILTYNIETVLAEKLETILIRNITNTRMRDYYDCKILHDLFKEEIDNSILEKVFYKTVESRKTSGIIKDFKNIIGDVKTDPNQKYLWSAYVNNNPYAKGTTFEQVIHSVEVLIKIIMED